MKFPKNKRAVGGIKALAGGPVCKTSKVQDPAQDQLQLLINLYSQGQLQQALGEALKLLQQFPNSIALFNIQGAANAGLGRFDAAVGAFNKALAIKPDNAGAYYNMGNALKEQGKLEEAIDAYNKALAIKPNYAECYSNMGVILKEKGKLEEAIEAYNKALAIKPDYADAYTNMGNTLKEQGKLEEAIESYNKALSLQPDSAEAYNNTGATLKQQGKLEEAIGAFAKAVAIKPDYADAYNNIGNALQEQGKLTEAIEAFNKALAIKPDYADARHMLSALIGETTNAPPREYVEKLFDEYAVRFESSLVGDLEYYIPKALTGIVLKQSPNGSLGSVLDLGCGTGLVGQEVKRFCGNLEGIDLSKPMLEQARLKNVYDELIHSDIIEYLSNEELNFDYFISTDVFIYVGNLTEVFRLIKSRNKQPGKLAFSTEHTEKDGFHLQKTGRYTHSKSYIEGLCAEFKYTTSHFSTSNLRKEKGQFLTGGLYILNF